MKLLLTDTFKERTLLMTDKFSGPIEINVRIVPLQLADTSE